KITVDLISLIAYSKGMRRSINTPYGNVKLVTLKEFTREIPIEKAYDFAGEHGMQLVTYRIAGGNDEYNPDGIQLELIKGDPFDIIKSGLGQNIGRDNIEIKDLNN